MQQINLGVKTVGVFAALSIGVFASVRITANAAQTKAVPPDIVTREFYDWYLHAGMPTPEKKNLATFRKYVAENLIKKQMNPDVDADLFIDAQDFDETWKNNFTVSKATTRGTQATVFVNLNGKQFKWKLRVTLQRQSNAWTISAVKNVAQ